MGDVQRRMFTADCALKYEIDSGLGTGYDKRRWRIHAASAAAAAIQ